MHPFLMGPNAFKKRGDAEPVSQGREAEVLPLLLQAAVLGATFGFREEAKTICAKLSEIRPDSEIPWIALAYAQMSVGKHRQAVKVLEKYALPRNPDHPLTQAFLALALKLAGDPGRARVTCDRVLRIETTGPAADMARAIRTEITNPVSRRIS
ncbi:tetratricopeptide repeat protein [Acanthopleuribacter pedis]|uniref:Tetratricopeptide repeat protein n=1 Tax=Acanthopleuribacter pedis TaxID=442870 RepID=A0A8J7U5W6_9BACT|nr:hypothetical protein [Acanthopleuribacter pedis]MBO1322983.1 hypothetical protein [Acanthopleuribacter pedis]